MRVIGGRAKGVKLAVPGGGTRPTADRVREALFNIISDRLEGARVLDVFAGSGALGIEALSRGAASCVFVENAPAALEAIRQNLERARLGEAAKVVKLDATRSTRKLARPGEAFDVIFVDAPYAVAAERDPARGINALLRACAEHLLAPGGTVIVEHAAGAFVVSESWGLRVVEKRTFGETELTFLERENN